MTIASKSRKNIIETYERYDRKLTLITFDADGNRCMTYQEYGFHDACFHMIKQANRGFTTRVYLDLPERFMTPKRIDSYEAMDMFLFKPKEVF